MLELLSGASLLVEVSRSNRLNATSDGNEATDGQVTLVDQSVQLSGVEREGSASGILLRVGDDDNLQPSVTIVIDTLGEVHTSGDGDVVEIDGIVH